MGTKKLIISPTSLYNDSFALAKQIFDSKFIPHLVISVMRGGVPIGLCIQEYIEHAKGKKTVIFNIAIKAESYTGIQKSQNKVRT